MKAFEYANPKSVEDAVGLLGKSWGETEVLAGGTDLLSSIKQGISEPGLVVSLKDVKGLGGISSKGGALRVGATATLAALVSNGDAQKHFPGLVTAASNVASQQMLNMGTVGGDLLQRPRCWYFRNGMGLLATQDGDSLVAKGDNRYHAILGNGGDAKFVSASSLAPCLIALGATVTVQGAGGSREVAVGDLYQTPKKENEREYTLKPNEVLTEISIPMNGLANATYEVRHRRGLDWPMVTASVAFKVSGGKASDAQLVLGHVAPVPWHSGKGSAALNGQSVPGAASAAADLALDDARPLSGNGYKVQQAKVAIRRAVAAAAG